MVQAPDFDRKMLLLATQLANEADMRRLLLSVLEALLESLDAEQSEIHTEAITLIRCIIRLVVKLMEESPANRYEDYIPPVTLHAEASADVIPIVTSKDSDRTLPRRKALNYRRQRHLVALADSL
ncbi:hypothetical protein EIP86_005833 [Pleurotus ostreatoroseus]|nr:hypothetical protein EIP86_005833 [Pleurotus ostreatoroseus]